jgi:hypothetical protein
VVDAAKVPLPDLAFTPNPENEAGYGKYFFFHRDNTDFQTAYADIRACDHLSRELNGPAIPMNTPYPYAGTLAGAAGGLIAAMILDATAGAAQRRAMRRDNMRTCMTFKEYQVYGLPKDLWSKFNFEEGLATVTDSDRERMLQMQARAASGPRPLVGDMQ